MRSQLLAQARSITQPEYNYKCQTRKENIISSFVAGRQFQIMSLNVIRFSRSVRVEIRVCLACRHRLFFFFSFFFSKHYASISHRPKSQSLLSQDLPLGGRETGGRESELVSVRKQFCSSPFAAPAAAVAGWNGLKKNIDLTSQQISRAKTLLLA
jgi:hypothetical protein